MNFKMKAAVVALALSASMSANAAMSTAASGDSSLILTLLDGSNNISAAFDLGYSYSSFAESLVSNKAGATNINWNLASGNYAPAWSTFTASANLATAKWAVFAGDNLGTTAGSRGMIVTYKTLPATLQTTSEMGTQLSGMDTYITASNNYGNHNVVADGADSVVNSVATTAAYAGNSKVYNANGQVGLKGPVTWAAFGEQMNVVKLSSGASALARLTADPYTNLQGKPSYFTLSNNGALTFAPPVPEADTWAMLLAGLGLMGFIARRRKAA